MDVVGDDGVEVDEGGAAHLAEVQQAVQLGGMSNLSLRRENNLLGMKGGDVMSTYLLCAVHILRLCAQTVCTLNCHVVGETWLSMRMEKKNTRLRIKRKEKIRMELKLMLRST